MGFGTMQGVVRRVDHLAEALHQAEGVKEQSARDRQLNDCIKQCFEWRFYLFLVPFYL